MTATEALHHAREAIRAVHEGRVDGPSRLVREGVRTYSEGRRPKPKPKPPGPPPDWDST